ncbi:MAG: hypothetical protein ACK4UO_08610 [Pseudolabrys sp.]
MTYRPTALILMSALLLPAAPAQAARPLLAEFLARAPAAAGAPAMPASTLEACLTRARALDSDGGALDAQVAALDRLAAEDLFLKNQIRAEIGAVEGYDEAGLKAFQNRVIRQSETTKRLEATLALYRQQQKAYDTAVATFERDCAQPFTAGDAAAAKARLGIK